MPSAVSSESAAIAYGVEKPLLILPSACGLETGVDSVMTFSTVVCAVCPFLDLLGVPGDATTTAASVLIDVICL